MNMSKLFGILSFIVGLASVFVYLISPITAGILAAVGAILAIVQFKRFKTGLAITGLVLSIIVIILVILILVSPFIALLMINIVHNNLESANSCENQPLEIRDNCWVDMALKKQDSDVCNNIEYIEHRNSCIQNVESKKVNN